jgi:hypothetical protein
MAIFREIGSRPVILYETLYQKERISEGLLPNYLAWMGIFSRNYG